MDWLKKELKELEEKHLLRKLTPISQRKSGHILINGKEHIDFSSNDYLGLSQHPEIQKAMINASKKFGVGSTGSRLLSGDYEIFHQLEDIIAKFKGKEAGLIFNSGYQMNSGIFSALLGKEDIVFADKLCHASLLDGILLSGAKLFRFKHNDLKHLEFLLKNNRTKHKKAMLVTESVFSMDGDNAPLRELVNLKKKYSCELFVDEAHATGVFGATGAGLIEEDGLTNDVEFIVGTFGKALGVFGAYLVCDEAVKQFLISKCRSFIYTTALPLPVIAANIKAIELVLKEQQRRTKVLNSANYLRKKLIEKKLKVLGNSQIIPIIISNTEKTIVLANNLQKAGFWVLPIRPPTVPDGQARLRISITALHKKKDLERLFLKLNSVL